MAEHGEKIRIWCAHSTIHFVRGQFFTCLEISFSKLLINTQTSMTIIWKITRNGPAGPLQLSFNIHTKETSGEYSIVKMRTSNFSRYIWDKHKTLHSCKLLISVFPFIYFSHPNLYSGGQEPIGWWRFIVSNATIYVTSFFTILIQIYI